jgi:hypothetical protein
MSHFFILTFTVLGVLKTKSNEENTNTRTHMQCPGRSVSVCLCCLIALDKETKSKATGNFYKETTTTKQLKGTRARHLPHRSGRIHPE